MKRIACIVLLVALTCAPASAIPGQTDAQVLAWGKANHLFTQFERANDDEEDGAGYDFVGFFKTGGYDAEFYAKPNRRGTIAREEVAIPDVPRRWTVAQNMPLFREVIHRIYGLQYLNDFTAASRIVNEKHVAVWRGKLLGYIGYNGQMFIVAPTAISALAANVLSCGAIDCSSGP